MSTENDWVPGTEPAQILVFQNIRNKISQFLVQLGIDAEREKKIHAACDVLVAALTYAKTTRAEGKAVTNWKNDIKNSPLHKGEPAAMPPVFSTFVMPLQAMRGALTFLRDEVILWKRAAGYNETIGLELEILPIGGAMPDDFQPLLSNWHFVKGFKMMVDWKKAGFKMCKFRYTPKGSTAHQDFFRVNSPAALEIVPQVPDQAETGFVEAIYINDDDQETGSWTDKHDVTLG